MSKKLVKFLTRKYTLLEDDIIAESLMKENTSVPEVYYDKFIDISKKGLIDIHIYQEDLEKNRKRVFEAAKKDNKYINEMLKKGLLAVKDLKVSRDLPKKIVRLSNDKTLKELNNLKQIFFKFSGYLDFTHHLGNCGVALTEKQIKEMGDFHEYRKQAFMNFLDFLKKVGKAIAKKKKVKFGNLSFLTLDEILELIKGDLSISKADEMQNKRKKHYILYCNSNSKRIITDNFEEELKKIKKDILEEEKELIRGMSINKGVIKGEVSLITQKKPLNKILPSRVMVTQMTSPNMTSILKKAKAIVTDEGGLLCHTANIAREFGIIAIVGTKIATKVLKDGDLVEVNANKGIVKIIKKAG